MLLTQIVIEFDKTKPMTHFSFQLLYILVSKHKNHKIIEQYSKISCFNEKEIENDAKKNFLLKFFSKLIIFS